MTYLEFIRDNALGILYATTILAMATVVALPIAWLINRWINK